MIYYKAILSITGMRKRGRKIDTFRSVIADHVEQDVTDQQVQTMFLQEIEKAKTAMKTIQKIVIILQYVEEHNGNRYCKDFDKRHRKILIGEINHDY